MIMKKNIKSLILLFLCSCLVFVPVSGQTPARETTVPDLTETVVPTEAAKAEEPSEEAEPVPGPADIETPAEADAAENETEPQQDDTADADETEQISAQTYQISLFTEPQVIKLPRATTSYWFYVPAGTEVEEASVSLYLETSATLLEDYSTATIEVNGIAVKSLNLVEFAAEKENVWDVEIPVEWLKTDGTLNQLSIITAQRSILGECADIDNPANWLVISEKSSLFLTLQHDGMTQLDNLYPFLFNRAELANKLTTGFVLAGSNPAAEFSAALNIAAAIGVNYPYKELDRMPVLEDKSQCGASCFVINSDSASDPALPELKIGEGYLSVSQDETGVAVNVAGGLAAGLNRAVRTLTDVDLLSQFSADDVILQHDPDRKSSGLSSREDGQYTLEDFHYSDISLAGAFHQHTSFTVYQPDGVMGGPGSYFEVHFRHSDALHSDTSLLTVQFDGTPASSIQLSRTNTENGSLRVRIPQEVLAKGSFEIGIDAYNYLGKIDCSKDWYDVAWTVIDADSVVYFEPSETTVVPSLRRFPSAFGSRVTVGIPEKSSEIVREAMLMLAVRNSQNTRTAPEFTVSNEFRNLEKSGVDIILAGSRKDILLPSDIERDLYIVPNGNSYDIKPGINVMPEALENKIILQTIRSPYDYKRVVYVIIWPDSSYEQELFDFIEDKTSAYQLSGQLVLLGRNGAVSIDAETATEAAVPFSPKLLINKIVRQTGIPRIGWGIILILFIVIIILMIRASRRKDRFETARDKMAQTNAGSANSSKPEANNEPDPDDDFDDEE